MKFIYKKIEILKYAVSLSPLQVESIITENPSYCSYG